MYCDCVFWYKYFQVERKKKKRQHYVRSNAQNLPLMSEHAKLFSLPHVCFTAAMRSFMEQMSLTVGRRLPTGSSASLGWIFLFYFLKKPHFLWCVGSYCIKPLKEMLVVILPCAVAKRNEELVPSCVQLDINLIWPKFTILVILVLFLRKLL